MMTEEKVRIYVRGDALEKIKDIKDLSGVSSYSEVVTILISKYYEHFVNSWKPEVVRNSFITPTSNEIQKIEPGIEDF
jgi:predicted CopG family antitoxin